MLHYILTIVCAAVVCALCITAAPKSGGGKLISFCGALCIAMTVISPLAKADNSGSKELIDGLLSFSEESEIKADHEKTAAYAACRNAAIAAEKLYKCSGSISAQCDTDEDGNIIEIRLDLPGHGESCTNEELSQVFECNVIISFTGGVP